MGNDMPISQSLGWKDVFADIHVIPWWETVRSHTLVVISASIIFYVVATSSGAVTCLPATNETNAYRRESMEFSDTEALFTSVKCKWFMPFGWLLNNYWWLSVLGTTCLFIANNFWEYNSAVVAKIKELKKFYDEFEKVRYPPNEELFHLVISPKELVDDSLPVKHSLGPKDSTAYYRKEARKLWKGILYLEKNDFVWWYNVRNIVSLFVAVIYSMISTAIVAGLANVEPEFDCVIENSNFVCIYTARSVVIPVTGTFFMMCLVQCSIFTGLLYKYLKFESFELFIHIVKHSGLGKSSTHKRFWKLRQYVKENKERLQRKMNDVDNLIRAVMGGDGEYFEIYYLVDGNCEAALESVIFSEVYVKDRALQNDCERMKRRIEQIETTAEDTYWNLETFADVTCLETQEKADSSHV